ncbi:helix-turn-helix domain-containing protein [Odoribacter sp. OttesenSCG-928-L07]|nr:helix-turn-helix domain-containing protein [Odoribacter sp. OttesenSCG-928-L07]
MTELNRNATFGEHLRKLREAINLSLREVALDINIDSSLLAKIERNERQPTKQQIKSIASFFKVDEKELLTEFLSDQIAYKILNEEADLNILKVAEVKVEYLKAKRNV